MCHGAVVDKVQQEATAGRDRLSYDPANLTAQSRADVLVRAPYKWDQLSETAKHAEILRIYNMASPYTRYYYDKGRYTTQVYQGVFVDENWAIRWFLWHSFRYRDNRDTRAPRADSSQGFGGKYIHVPEGSKLGLPDG